MVGYRRVFLLVLILTGVAFALGGAALFILYETAVEQTENRLGDLVHNEAAILSALVINLQKSGMAPLAAREVALQLVDEAHDRTRGIGETGEFAIAREEGDRVVYLLLDRRPHGSSLLTVAAAGSRDEAMRAALAGNSGHLIGRDHRGRDVVSAYMPIPLLDAGIVAKIDLPEIRQPFARAGIAVIILAVVLVGLGTTLFFQVTEPMVRNLRNKERRFRELVDRMNSGLLVLRVNPASSEFAVHDANKAAETIDRLPREWMIGRPLTEVLPGAAACGLLDACRNVWASGQSQTMREVHYVDARLAQWREIRLYRLPSADVVCLYDDITTRKATEERLQQKQKLELLGQLTGGIAHDFNNILGIIVGNLQLMEEGFLFDDGRQMLADALWAANRGAELTHQLLAYARRQPLKPQLTDVNKLIETMADVLRRAIDVDVVFRPTLSQRVCSVHVDCNQLQSAIVNLVVNAREAMPNGGTATIETSDIHLSESEPMAAEESAAAGDYVMISVRDTGIGMRPEVAKRALEPFFTTKGAAKGSGLGLSMVYGFVKQSGGYVRIQTGLGDGTSVDLFLPRAAGVLYPADSLELPMANDAAAGMRRWIEQTAQQRQCAPEPASA